MKLLSRTYVLEIFWKSGFSTIFFFSLQSVFFSPRRCASLEGKNIWTRIDDRIKNDEGQVDVRFIFSDFEGKGKYFESASDDEDDGRWLQVNLAVGESESVTANTRRFCVSLVRPTLMSGVCTKVFLSFFCVCFEIFFFCCFAFFSLPLV